MVGFNEKIIITSGLPYSNGEAHLGHLVSTYLPADIFARFCMLKGAQVVRVCGTDDYGTPILINAEKEGKKPEKYVKHWYERWSKDLADTGIIYDIFYQTNSPENIKLAQHFFAILKEKGFIFKQEIEQPFCEKCQRFLPDRYIKGICPHCGAKEQYSDGCDKCGKAFQTGEIIEPRCIVCGTIPFNKKSVHYFFKLSAFTRDLKKWLKENKNLQPEVRNYVLKWIEDGLKEWDITRDISWGVPIPLKEARGKVLYGWFDNHLGYISFTLKYLADKGIDGKQFWNSAKIYHFIGKGIVYHHYLFLPAMRLGEGSFKLPDFIPTRGHLLLLGEKFSKSKGWYVGLRDFLKIFPPDYLRYYLAVIIPYNQSDINFDWKEFQARINNELIATIGNFVNRALTFTWSKFGGVAPEAKGYDELDKEFEKRIRAVAENAGEQLQKIELDRGMRNILEFTGFCNQYFQKKEPWSKKGAETCLYLCINAVRALAILLEPYIPFSCEKLWDLLNLPGNVHEQKWESASELGIKPGHEIKRPKILFEKIEDEEIERQIKKLGKTGGEIGMEEISFGEFQRLDMRIGEVLAVEAVPESKNLLKLKVGFGTETRQSVAGIAQQYRPEDLIGKKFVFVVNLKPAKLMGIESNCMILAAEGGKGKIALLKPSKDVETGSKVK